MIVGSGSEMALWDRDECLLCAKIRVDNAGPPEVLAHKPHQCMEKGGQTIWKARRFSLYS